MTKQRDITGALVAVVGGAGFLGSHLVQHLIDDRNCDVIVLDNLVVGQRRFLHPEATFHWLDVTGSEDHIRQHLDGVEYVFNYAAYPYVPDSYDRPLHVFNVNAFGAMKVINAAQAGRAKGILQVSSAEIYGETSWIGSNGVGRETRLTEGSPVQPHSTYGAAKAAVDFFVQSRWREAKTPCLALRQFNCVGARETHPYVVPEIISQLQGVIDNSTLGRHDDIIAHISLGNNSFRDFLSAKVAVKMATNLMECGEWGEAYNLGSETGIQVYDLAEVIATAMGFDSVKVTQDKSKVRRWEIWHLQSDNSKINSVLEPGMRLTETGSNEQIRQGVEAAVEWFRTNDRRWPWED